MIPLYHPLTLSRVAVDFVTDAEQFTVTVEVRCETVGRTGVEMEALMGASTGLLTIYDMLKAVDKGMVIEQVALLQKSGGKSGAWRRDEQGLDKGTSA